MPGCSVYHALGPFAEDEDLLDDLSVHRFKRVGMFVQVIKGMDLKAGWETRYDRVLAGTDVDLRKTL
jgi:hypothetical protein